MLPMAYTEPELAREILRYSIKLQPEVPDGFVPYGTGPLCTRFDLGTSNDLDFWLLLAAAEYGLGARDPDFFDEQLPFHDTKRSESAWEHIKRAYRHQESMKGPNGGYIDGRDRRLVGLRDPARADDRVDARRRPARLRVSEARRAGRAARRRRLRRASCGPARPSCSKVLDDELDRQGLVRARLRSATARSARA